MAGDNSNPESETRVVLDGVPYIGFDHFGKRRWVETCPFPACLRAWLEFMGDGITQESGGWATPAFGYGPAFGYTHAMSTSGVGFQLLWHADEWDEGNLHVMRMDSDRKRHFRRALQCAGYSHEVSYVGEKDRDEAFFRDAIVESIRGRKHPLIAFGVVGPKDRPVWSRATTRAATC